MNTTAQQHLSRLSDKKLKEAAEEIYNDITQATLQLEEAKRFIKSSNEWFFEACTEMNKRGIKRD